jgi:hypothetical protein
MVTETRLQHAEKIIIESGFLYTIIASATALAYMMNNVIYSPLSGVVCHLTPSLSVHRGADLFVSVGYRCHRHRIQPYYHPGRQEAHK